MTNDQVMSVSNRLSAVDLHRRPDPFQLDHAPTKTDDMALPLTAKDVVNDLYGFQISVTVQQQAVRLQADGVSSGTEALWLPFVQSMTLPPENKLKGMIRKGVPPTLRPWVWMEVSGAAVKKAAVGANYFTNMMLAGTERSPYLKDIDQDISHTFPNHPWLQEPDGQAAMRRVLAAYSVHNEVTGYCRSMNHIVGLLLVSLNRNEEAAFWLLAALVEDIVAPGTYSGNLEGAQVEMKALDELLSQKMPRLAAHLHELEADVSILATDWYLTLFATSMPAETAVRVWDALFNEGSKVLFRISLALLKDQEEHFMQYSNAGELLLAVRSHASSMHDRDRLMEVAFEGVGSLSLAVIEHYREQRSHQVEAAVRDHHGKQTSGIEGGESKSGNMMTVNQQLGEMTARANVIGKQAASNLKKGFSSFMAGAKELSAKATAEMQKQRNG